MNTGEQLCEMQKAFAEPLMKRIAELEAELAALKAELAALKANQLREQWNNRPHAWGHALAQPQGDGVIVPRELLEGVIGYCDNLLDEVNSWGGYAGSTGADSVHHDSDYLQLRALLGGDHE